MRLRTPHKFGKQLATLLFAHLKRESEKQANGRYVQIRRFNWCVNNQRVLSYKLIGDAKQGGSLSAHCGEYSARLRPSGLAPNIVASRPWTRAGSMNGPPDSLVLGGRGAPLVGTFVRYSKEVGLICVKATMIIVDRSASDPRNMARSPPLPMGMQRRSPNALGFCP
jgi:hypothetical protein